MSGIRRSLNLRQIETGIGILWVVQIFSTLTFGFLIHILLIHILDRTFSNPGNGKGFLGLVAHAAGAGNHPDILPLVNGVYSQMNSAVTVTSMHSLLI